MNKNNFKFKRENCLSYSVLKKDELYAIIYYHKVYVCQPSTQEEIEYYNEMRKYLIGNNIIERI